jgi:hypothetical protein
MNTNGCMIERRDGRTILRDEDGLALFSLPGEVPDDAMMEIVRIRNRAFELGIRTGRNQHAYELRKLLREGEE